MGNCLQTPEVAKSPSQVKEEAKKATATSKAKQKAKPPPVARHHSSLHESITVSEHRMHQNIFDYYDKVKHIAQGSTCDVWTIRKKNTDEMYALKIISKRDTNQAFIDEMRNEISILKSIDHPNVFRVYEMFESSHSIYMVSEFCAGGDLYSLPLPYSEPRAAMVLTKILSAVTYLHTHHVVHRDLKPENVLYDDHGEPKVIDFGLSKPNVTKGKNLKCRVGTLVTMSPQVLKGQYTEKADIWAIGCIAYILLSGKRPFDGKTDKDIANKIIKGEYSMDNDEDWANVSQPAKDFCKSLLAYNPDKRPSATQALRDPWLRKNAPLATPQPSAESMTRVANALVRSARDGKLKKIAAMMIAYKSSNESIKELRDAFNAIDVNNHGAINLWEFRSALKKCSNFSDEELKEMFKDIDVNNTGMINYTEFLATTLESRGRIEEDLIADAFDRIDTDKSGYLSREELCSIMGKTGSAENCDAMVDEILSELDTAKDGRISFDEFMVLFRDQHRKGVSDQYSQLKQSSPEGKC